VLVFLVIGLGACSSGSSSAACGVSGRERSCDCPKGAVGIQACGFDGAWTECTCYVTSAPAGAQVADASSAGARAVATIAQGGGGVSAVGSAGVGAAGQGAAGTDAAGSDGGMNAGGMNAGSGGRGGSFAAAGRGWFVPPFFAGRGGLRGAAGLDQPGGSR
jgi:pilus assembly protein FimV